jgi:hypothetical protein
MEDSPSPPNEVRQIGSIAATDHDPLGIAGRIPHRNGRDPV